MTRWYLRRVRTFGDVTVAIEMIMEEGKDTAPKVAGVPIPRGIIGRWNYPAEFNLQVARRALRDLRAELARRIAAVDAPVQTYSPEEVPISSPSQGA